MGHARSALRRSLVTLSGLVMLTTGLSGVPTAQAAPGHTGIVGRAPSGNTPNISDGRVNAIYDAGSKVIAGGTFTQAQNPGSTAALTRNYLLAFDKATGVIDTAFAPTVDGEVTAVIAGPTAGTVFIAGSFDTVAGQTRRKVALLSVADGRPTSWRAPALNGKVNDVVIAAGRLILAGSFTTVGGVPHYGLASVNLNTGALDPYVPIAVTTNHNWNGTGTRAAVGVDKIAVTPDNRKLVAIGNFKRACAQSAVQADAQCAVGDATDYDQAVMLDLGTTSAAIANWHTNRYDDRCASGAFDSWVRDVSVSPDGSYFVIVTTGAPFAGTLCDTAARWETGATGRLLQPTWIDYSGGDTLLSVTITEYAVYVGGHIRWMNNTLGRDSQAAGAMPRPSMAALDPLSGVPLRWNPGRRPRGYGITELYATSAGLWIGHDTEFVGNYQWRRQRLAFIPLSPQSGGYVPHATNVSGLPGNVYRAGNVSGAASVNDMFRRSYDGATSVGSSTQVSDTVAWSTARGAFWVGGTLFYGMNGGLYRRTFNGTAFGPPALVDPYHDTDEDGAGPDIDWDDVPTDFSRDPSQTYVGVTTNFYAEINNVTGMFYDNGRLYYTLAGQQGLFWRWFSPDSGAVGPDRFTVAGATGFLDSGGVFVALGNIYLVSRTTGSLWARPWVDGAPSGSASIVNSTSDWRGQAVFLAP